MKNKKKDENEERFYIDIFKIKKAGNKNGNNQRRKDRK